MTEKSLKSSVSKMIKSEFPTAFFYKASDRFYSGIPDIIGCMNGRFFAVELKSKNGKVSLIQAFTLRTIGSAGGSWCVAKSVEEVRNFLKQITKETERG